MKYCRFTSPDGPRFGLIETVAGTQQITQTTTGELLPDFSKAKKITDQPLSSTKLLFPVQPSKIVCVGRNYSEHAKELGNEVPSEPLIFFKPPSSLISPGEKIVRPKRFSQRVEFEAELTVLIGKKCRILGPNDDVRPYILGYTCANDVTARDLQKKDGQWTRGKGFDTFCAVGPCLVSKDELDFASLRVRTLVDGVVKQDGSVRDMIFPLDAIIAYITAFMTLEPGDLIGGRVQTQERVVVHGHVPEVSFCVPLNPREVTKKPSRQINQVHALVDQFASS